jgi:hypothetical protein
VWLRGFVVIPEFTVWHVFVIGFKQLVEWAYFFVEVVFVGLFFFEIVVEVVVKILVVEVILVRFRHRMIDLLVVQVAFFILVAIGLVHASPAFDVRSPLSEALPRNFHCNEIE